MNKGTITLRQDDKGVYNGETIITSTPENMEEHYDLRNAKIHGYEFSHIEGDGFDKRHIFKPKK